MALTETAPAANPKVGRTADPCVMVIFGVTGDLTRRKLLPALYNLASQHLLSREFAVLGIGRNPMTTDEARKKLSEEFRSTFIRYGMKQTIKVKGISLTSSCTSCF